MNRVTLKNEMVRYVGGGAFIKKVELARFMNLKDPNSCNKYLAGLDSIGRGLYFIDDVVRALLDG